MTMRKTKLTVYSAENPNPVVLLKNERKQPD